MLTVLLATLPAFLVLADVFVFCVTVLIILVFVNNESLPHALNLFRVGLFFLRRVVNSTFTHNHVPRALRTCFFVVCTSGGLCSPSGLVNVGHGRRMRRAAPVPAISTPLTLALTHIPPPWRLFLFQFCTSPYSSAPCCFSPTTTENALLVSIFSIRHARLPLNATLKARLADNPWFPSHPDRDTYVTLLQQRDPAAPEVLLKAALLRRAVADVHRIMRIKEDKGALNNLIQKGAVGDDLWTRFLATEKELEAEIVEVISEANSFREGWGQIIFQTASEIVNNEKTREMYANLNRAKTAVCKLDLSLGFSACRLLDVCQPKRRPRPNLLFPLHLLLALLPPRPHAHRSRFPTAARLSRQMPLL